MHRGSAVFMFLMSRCLKYKLKCHQHKNANMIENMPNILIKSSTWPYGQQDYEDKEKKKKQ